MRIDVIYRDQLVADNPTFAQMTDKIGGLFRVEDVVEGKQMVAMLPAKRKFLDAYMDNPNDHDILQMVESLAKDAFLEILVRTEE